MRNIFNINRNSKTYSKIVALLFWVSIAVVPSGCKKFVDAGAPPTQMVTLNVFKTATAATAALQNIYVQMYNTTEFYNLEYETGLLSDELKDYSGGSVAVQYYTNSLTSESYFGPWSNAYNFIFQANAILEGLQDNDAINPAIVRQLTGEAKFVRAFWNFYLTNCYGDVPLANSTSYTTNRTLARTLQADVYKQIIKDLTDAQGLLSDRFVDASDTTETVERVRPSKWAATALLARAYLYTKDYGNAEIQSTAVINYTQYFSLETDLNNVFKANSLEAIWQLGVPLPNQYNTPEGYFFILHGEPSTQAISDQLVNAFEPNDKRFTDWINSYTTPDMSMTYYYPFKYKVFNDVTVSEYSTILRLSEQYLIRAEARAHGAGTGLPGAISDLNEIRNRAGLPDYSGTEDAVSVSSAILHERQVELFTEGHRWFDLVRTNNANAVMGAPGNVCQSKGGSWSADWQLFPIPQADRSRNLNMSQNNGY